jgi:hypothetical protein
MSMAARDPITGIVHTLVACIRLLSSDKPGEVDAAIAAVQRLLKGDDVRANIHALADRIENGSGLSEDDKKKICSEIERAHEVGYEKGVRAAEARFRPDGQLGFSEVALFVARERHRLRPYGTREANDNRDNFLDKMEHYALQGFEPQPKQGKWLFDLFLELGGKIT